MEVEIYLILNFGKESTNLNFENFRKFLEELKVSKSFF